MELQRTGAILLMASMALLADYVLKIATTKNTIFNIFFLFGMIIYSLTAFVWYFVLKNTKFSEANLFYSLFTIIISVAIGIIIFREHLTFIETLGVVLSIISILILSRFA